MMLISALGIMGCVLGLGALILRFVIPNLWDVEVSGARIRFRVLGCITAGRWDLADLRDAREIDTFGAESLLLNPFRTLRLGNRLSGKMILLKFPGLFCNVIVTPRDPRGFLCAVENARLH